MWQFNVETGFNTGLGTREVRSLRTPEENKYSTSTQIFQNPLIKEYTLIYTKDPYFELGYIP